jgi:hypothetical protein
MRWAWMSAGGATASSALTDTTSGRAVIGRLLGDRHVMHVTLAYAGVVMRTNVGRVRISSMLLLPV